jgi:predicted RNA binding protein YcfA (HicA-like mRNA interferase family)
MPRKLRELRADLRKHGFVRLKGRGKGDHEVWKHPTGARVGLDGKDGQDAKPYQEKQVRAAIEDAERRT